LAVIGDLRCTINWTTEIFAMFVEKKNVFEKKFYAKIEESGRVTAKKIPVLQDAKRTKDAVAKLEKDGFTLHTVVFRMLSWGEHCRIMRECVRTDAETSMRFHDSYEIDTKKLVAVLHSWDFTRVNSSGETVKTDPDESTVKMLYPPLAEFLLKLYDEEGELSPDAEKNS